LISWVDKAVQSIRYNGDSRFTGLETRPTGQSRRYRLVWARRVLCAAQSARSSAGWSREELRSSFRRNDQHPGVPDHWCWAGPGGEREQRSIQFRSW